MRTYEQRFDDEITPQLFRLEFEAIFDYLSGLERFSSFAWSVSDRSAQASYGNEPFFHARRSDPITIEVVADDLFARTLENAGYQQVFIRQPPNDPYDQDDLEELFG